MNLTAWRYRRFHPSYLLAWLGAGLLVGLILGRSLDVATNTPFLLVGLILILGAFRSRRWWAVVAVVAAGVCLGMIRSHSVQLAYQAYEPLVIQTVTVRGVMTGDAQRANSGRQKVTLGGIIINGREYPGEIFVTVFGDSHLKRGDKVTVEGTLREGFAAYGAAVSSGKIVHIERGNDMIRDIRERFSEAVRSVVVEPMASLGLGFVVGQRSTLPDTLDEQLKVVGLTHIVVASGYNLTILVRFMMRLLARYSRYLAFVSSLAMILTFVLFSGLSPSMNRAVIVTVLSLLAWYVGRRFHPVLLIAYVASVTALVNPMYVWADLGWYLSFFAFGGILIVAPLVMKLLYRRRKPSSFEQLVIETMSAELTALPLIAFAFATLPVFGLLANVLVAPFIPAAMALTAMTGIFGMVSIALASVVAMPTTILIGYMIAVVEWLAELPMAQYTLDLGIWVIGVWYLLLVAGCVFVQRKMGYDFRKRDSQLEV
jgi:competence protein ComEC